jgi:GNAT superfamily N-acetyltransferase
MRWLGAGQRQVHAKNRLDFHTIDWAMIGRWIEDGRARSPQSTLVLCVDRLPADGIQAYCDRCTQLFPTMPRDDADYGEIVLTPDTVQTYYRLLDDVGGAHHVYLLREPDGTISGLTDVLLDASRPGFVEQLFTGVDPAYRRQGKGKLLKASMLELLRLRHPDTRWVTTGNATSNAAMLGINDALGFRRERIGVTYQIERDRLAAFLAGRV